MGGQILTDADYLKDVKAIEKRLDAAITTAKGYLTPDESNAHMNEAVLEILLFIKTGKSL